MPPKVEPGRDPEMAQRTQVLNVVFALTSIALLITFSWMIWADYNREWKQYQKKFTDLDVQRTKTQIKDVDSKVDATKRQQLEQQIAQSKTELAANRAEIEKAEDELAKLQGEWYGVDQDFRFTKAKIDVAKYDYEEAAHKDPKGAADEKKDLDKLEKDWADYRVKLEDVEARKAAVQARLNALQKNRLESEKIQKELFADKTRLEDKLEKIEPGFVSFVRNMPILDLANPSLKVQQILPANLKDDVIFTATEKVDRCTTCHLGIDKKGFEDAPQPYRTHPNLELYVTGPHPMDRVGCTVCHQGRGRATGFVAAAHTPLSREQEIAWGKYSKSKEYHGVHHWDLPMLTKGSTESQCVKCHQNVIEVPKATNLNVGRQLIEKNGCYGCHKIKGWEDLRKVGPDLTKITSKTNEDWIYRWIKEPKGFRPTRMPQAWDVRPHETADQLARNNVEANAVAAYIVANSSTETYPAPPGGDLTAGRKVFETVGCLACHRVGDDQRGMEVIKTAAGKDVPIAAASFRTHGPNLDGTGTKLNAGWVYSWVKNPKGYWHETRMPNLRLTDREAADVTAYLMSLKNDEFMARQRPALDTTLRDKAILEILENTLTKGAAKAKFDSMDDRQKTLFLGERTIGRYGCFGCHTIKGFEKTSPIGVELTEEGSKLVERLDFGFQHGKIAHTLPAWVKLKVKEPRIYDEGKHETKKPEEWLRMPKFWVSDDEADAIVTAVLSFTKEQVPLAAQKQLSADDRYVERGRRLVREFNCQGCHVIGDRGGSIQAVIKDHIVKSGGDDLQTQALSPPMLYNAKSKIGEGARVHTDWLHDFLRDPSDEIRPWLDIRMPTFEFTETQLNEISRNFAAQDGVPYPYEPVPTSDPAMVAAGRELFTKWQCVKCHIQGGKLPDQEPAAMAPDLALVPQRLRADWLTKWLANPGHIIPGTRMPSNFPEDPKDNSFPEYFGGDQKQQIEAVRAYLLTLGSGSATKPRPAAGRPIASR
jgi:cytochrome c2